MTSRLRAGLLYAAQYRLNEQIMATLSSREGLKKRESRERSLVLTVLFVGPGSAKVCVKRRDVFEFRQQK